MCNGVQTILQDLNASSTAEMVFDLLVREGHVRAYEDKLRVMTIPVLNQVGDLSLSKCCLFAVS